MVLVWNRVDYFFWNLAYTTVLTLRLTRSSSPSVYRAHCTKLITTMLVAMHSLIIIIHVSSTPCHTHHHCDPRYIQIQENCSSYFSAFNRYALTRKHKDSIRRYIYSKLHVVSIDWYPAQHKVLLVILTSPSPPRARPLGYRPAHYFREAVSPP